MPDRHQLDPVVLVRPEGETRLLVPFADGGEPPGDPGADLKGLAGGVEIHLESIDQRVVAAGVSTGGAGAVGGQAEHACRRVQVDQGLLVLVACGVGLD